MIDIHCHVLPGIDDGPFKLDGSLELARAAAGDGTTVLVATPHVSHGFPNDSGVIAAGVARVNDALREAGVRVEVKPGAEVAHDMLPRLEDDELRALTLGGGPNLLLEAPLAAVGGELEEAIERVHGLRPRRGAGPSRALSLLPPRPRSARAARGGRCCDLRDRRLLRWRLRRHGAQAHRHARQPRPHPRRGLRRTRRGAQAAAAALDPAGGASDGLPGLAGQIDWLARDVPRALVAGDPLPPAPPPPGARRRGVRLPWRSGRGSD